MKIDILVCTIDGGIADVPHVLMPPQEGIGYVVSMQYTDRKWLEMVPRELRERADVRLTCIEGRGLSRNRNNAMEHADADVCILADDDNCYSMEGVQNVIDAYRDNPEADIIHFQAMTRDGALLHEYPADYVCSVEMTFRSDIPVRFNENFGLGSPLLCAGEEQVFIKDAQDAGLSVVYCPKLIVVTDGVTTGSQLAGNRKLQFTKGATFRYVYGTASALWRSVKEAGWYFVHKGKNPFPIFYNMCRGVFWNLSTHKP